MMPQLHRPLLASALTAVLSVHAASAAAFSDDFSGAELDAGAWMTGGTSGVAQVDGTGNLIIDVNFNGGSHRRMAVTQISDFNPFSGPITIHLNGIAVAGTPDANPGHFANGFMALGLSNGDAANNYHVEGAGFDTAVAVLVNLSPAGTYDLTVREYVNGSEVAGPVFALDGAPTGVTLTVDGAAQTMAVTVTGTTFTASGLTTQNRTLHADFTAESMSLNGDVVSRITLGALNRGSVQPSGSKFTVGSINVGPVPEPATAGLIGAGLLLTAARPR